MKITYTYHARQRMRERSVQEEDVERCLTQYVERVQGRGGYRYKGPGVSGHMLKVWVVPPDDDPADDKIVKSVAWEG
jgi:Domain of unknown function (DUF4258)